MMWLLPAVVVVLAALPLVLAIRRVVFEIVQLRREVNAFSDLRPALVELRTDAQALGRGLAQRSERLPRRR